MPDVKDKGGRLWTVWKSKALEDLFSKYGNPTDEEMARREIEILKQQRALPPAERNAEWQAAHGVPYSEASYWEKVAGQEELIAEAQRRTPASTPAPTAADVQAKIQAMMEESPGPLPSVGFPQGGPTFGEWLKSPTAQEFMRGVPWYKYQYEKYKRVYEEEYLPAFERYEAGQEAEFGKFAAQLEEMGLTKSDIASIKANLGYIQALSLIHISEPTRPY